MSRDTRCPVTHGGNLLQPDRMSQTECHQTECHQTECHRPNVTRPNVTDRMSPDRKISTKYFYMAELNQIHYTLIQINRMFHFCVCVLFKFDGQNSNLKRTNKQSLLKDFFWGFLKRNIFWISLRVFKLAFITLQIFWLLTLKANYYLFMVVNLLGLNLNRGCCDLVDRKIINLGAKCLEFISKQILLGVF